VKITRFVTEYLLPLLACPCCGKVNAARPPAGAYVQELPVCPLQTLHKDIVPGIKR